MRFLFHKNYQKGAQLSRAPCKEAEPHPCGAETVPSSLLWCVLIKGPFCESLPVTHSVAVNKYQEFPRFSMALNKHKINYNFSS